MRRLQHIVPFVSGALAALLVLMAGWPQAYPVTAQPAAPTSFIEHFTFDSSNAHTAYRPAGWDVTVIAHENDTIEPMWAEHGATCSAPDPVWAPGSPPNPATNHRISLASETVFACRDHLMTATNAGYSAIYLTPPAMLDFRNGPATIEWDMSTQHTSSRDWVDFVLMPFSPAPMAINLNDAHAPAPALWVQLLNGNVFMPHLLTRNTSQAGCGNGSYTLQPSGVLDCRFSFDGYNGIPQVLARYGLAPSAARRDHFRMTVSQTHLTFGFRPTPTAPYFNWVDANIPGGLPFTEGIIQLNQRAYNPLKGCGPGVGDAGYPPEGWAQCRAGTWHWDEVSISPASLFTILPGPRRVVGSGSTTFPLPAPENSFIKTAGDWNATYSYDGGATWRPMPEVGPRLGPENGISYWAPVPAGTRTVMFRGNIQDVYLYSSTPREAIPEPPVPTEVPVPSTPIPASTASPLPIPTTSPTTTPPTPVSTSTAVPGPATPTPAPPTPTVSPAPVCQVQGWVNGVELRRTVSCTLFE